MLGRNHYGFPITMEAECFIEEPVHLDLARSEEDVLPILVKLSHSLFFPEMVTHALSIPPGFVTHEMSHLATLWRKASLS